MPYVRTDDRVRLYYEEHGPTDPDATGSPLVLAYGIGGNADLWDVNIPALAARHRLEVVELRPAGNELEVIATVLDNVWAGLSPEGPRLVWRLCGLASRLVVNPLTLLLSHTLGKWLPRRYYLSTLCVLRKAS